jgi:hypothetical protein
MEIFGTRAETWIRTSKGLFLIQSNNMQSEYEDHSRLGLPDNAVKLNPAICYDLHIPEDLREDGA